MNTAQQPFLFFDCEVVEMYNRKNDIGCFRADSLPLIFYVIVMKGITSIQVEVKTRNRLLQRGKKGDTYDDIINRLLDSEESG